MINPLLEEFDPARRPLLFLWNLGCCASKRRVGLNCPNLATSESAICAHFAKQAETAPTIASAIADTPRRIMIPLRQSRFGCPRCLEELRRRSWRQCVSERWETGWRAVARSASIVNQVQ
jgi:hypothetical protein